MTLDYELTAIPDHKEVCYEPTKDGKFKMSVPCYTAIHLALGVGIPCLETDADIEEFYFRAKAFEMAGLTCIYESEDNIAAGWPDRRNHTLAELRQLRVALVVAVAGSEYHLLGTAPSRDKPCPYLHQPDVGFG